MPEARKREIAYKLRIGSILQGSQIFEETESLNKRLRHVELGKKKIVRVNVIANVVDKYESDGEKRFASLTIDDGTGQIRARVFGDDIQKFKDCNQGDTVLVIGLLRSFNQELYILPEIVRKTDPRYLLIRKRELEKEQIKPNESKSVIKALKDEIITRIKEAEEHEGVQKDELIMTIKAEPDLISQEMQKLLEEGLIYEPRPGRVRYLG